MGSGRKEHTPPHLDAAPLAAQAGQHIRGAARLPADLAARARGQVPLPPVVVMRVLWRGRQLARPALPPPPPPRPRPPAPAHVVPVPVLVALAAVAAGEGHTVGVNVQLTHWGAGRVRGLSPLPWPLPPSPCISAPT